MPSPSPVSATLAQAHQAHGRDASEAQANFAAHAALRSGPGFAPVALGASRGAPESSLSPHALSTSVSRTLAQTGSPLPAGERQWMEQRLGHRFDGVRILDDGVAGQSARELGASAYTVGQRVAFAPGAYRPGSTEGRQLLAHELIHVLQQKQSGPRLQMQVAGTTTSGAATSADQRDFIRDTVQFFERSAEHYQQVATVGPAVFDRVIDSWYSMVVRQEQLIDSALAGDAALKASLRAAYTAALRVLVSQRAAAGGGSEDDLYRINSGRIPLWAQPHPSHLEAGVTTPIPDDVTVTQRRGRFLFSLNGFDVTVSPDTRVRRQSDSGLTHRDIHWGGIRARFRGARGNLVATSLSGPPTPRLTLFTSYRRGVDTTATSAYGRGTTAEDVAGARVTTESDSLAFHESRHSQATLDFIRANRPPAFTRQVGDAMADVNAAITQWQSDARDYSNRLSRADKDQVHCVGFTIDQFHLANARRGQRIVQECP